jgi:hypothetical protein
MARRKWRLIMLMIKVMQCLLVFIGFAASLLVVPLIVAIGIKLTCETEDSVFTLYKKLTDC